MKSAAPQQRSTALWTSCAICSPRSSNTPPRWKPAWCLGDTTQAVAGNARQQADAASSTAATVEEVSSSISQIADGAQQAARAAEDTGELSEQLAELVQDTAGEIRQAASAVKPSPARSVVWASVRSKSPALST